MSRKMTKSDLSRADISLLINSEEAKNTQLYGNLYDILVQIRDLKAITLEELKSRNLNHDGVSALTHNRHTLIDNATKEWRATSTVEINYEKNARCRLCNAPNLKFECHIRNIKNNIELLVGSECVNKFKIDGYIEQEKQLKDIKKGQKIVQRRNQFYNRFPDYEDFISNTEKYFSTLPILLPYELYIKLQNTIERMRLIATKYVNEGKKPYDSQLDSFDLFQLATDNYNRLKIDSDKYINSNINKELICKRPEIDWMISENKTTLLQQISENGGLYTLNTLKNMYSFSFVKGYLELILSRNNSDLMRFEKITEGSIVFSFNKFGYQPSISFATHLKNFIQYIGADCIINDSFGYGSKEILSISNIINSKGNLLSIIEYIDNMMNLLNCVFLLDETSKSLYLCRKGDRAVRQFSYYTFMKNYSKYILLPDEEIKKYLISIVKGTNNIKWVTPEMQAKQGIDEKIGVLYKAYKESHEYNTRPTGRIIELMTYSIYDNNTTNTPKLDFNSSEYIALQKSKLRISDSQLRSVEYGLRIKDESLSPLYHKGDILFIQTAQKFKSDAILFFASTDEVLIQEYHSESEEPESIFNFSNIPKKELIAYGKIIYCYQDKSNKQNDSALDAQSVTIQNKVKIFVIENPRYCFNCSSKCTYKHIQYIQENKKHRQINVAICHKCNKYYIDRNSYLTYINSKKETNLHFILPE